MIILYQFSLPKLVYITFWKFGRKYFLNLRVKGLNNIHICIYSPVLKVPDAATNVSPEVFCIMPAASWTGLLAFKMATWSLYSIPGRNVLGPRMMYVLQGREMNIGERIYSLHSEEGIIKKWSQVCSCTNIKVNGEIWYSYHRWPKLEVHHGKYVCSVILCVMFCLRTESSIFAYNLRIASIILHTARFLCIIYA